MLLSEMFGVELGEKFRVDGYCGEFMVKSQGNFERLYRVLAEGDFDKERNVNVLSDIINGAPDNIIHLPPPLTDEQREQLKALYTIGYPYLAKDSDGTVYAYETRPHKVSQTWYYESGDTYMLCTKQTNCLRSLVSNYDPEPYDIGKALGVGE